MHLNWFSPLPPAMTDVANFTARVLPALAGRVALTLWTDQPNYDKRLERHADVRIFSGLSKTEFSSGRTNVFNLGNNRAFHKNILRLCRTQSGIIILHDLFLPNLIPRMRREILAALRVSPDKQANVLRQRALANALGVIVHTRAAFETLRHEIDCPVRFQPLPYLASERKPARPTRTTLPIRLVAFGFLGSNRRLESTLRALHTYPRKKVFHLDIYGVVPKARAIRRLIRKLDLDESVTLHGFVSEADLNQALDIADLAINLRYPTMGEASGSQLRLWDHALPSLVTPVGWYAELPPGTAGWVDPKNEIGDLHAHFDIVHDEPDFYRRMGERGRATLIADHRPDAYADALLNLVRQASPDIQANPPLPVM